MTPSILARIMARHQLARRDVLAVVIFSYGHPEQSFSLALKRYIAGEGPAAVAMGRAVEGGVRLAPERVETVSRETREAA